MVSLIVQLSKNMKEHEVSTKNDKQMDETG